MFTENPTVEGHLFKLDRSINQPLRPILRDLALAKVDFLNFENNSVCFSLPENILGSFVVAQIANELTNIYIHNKQAPPEKLHSPFYSVYTDLPCYYKNYGGQRISIAQRAKTILLKHACGNNAGVVTTGELAGVIISPVDERDIGKGVMIKRLYNDELLQSKNFVGRFISYPHSFTDSMYATSGIQDTPVDTMAIEYFKRMYDIQVLSRFNWASQALQSFCLEHAIPFDSTLFTYTRNLQEDLLA